MKINIKCKGQHQGCQGRIWSEYIELIDFDNYFHPKYCHSCKETIEKKILIDDQKRFEKQQAASEIQKQRLRENHSQEDYP